MQQNISLSEKKENIRFYSLIALASIIIILGYLARVPTLYLGWFSFFLASMSVAGNDAIQTIGTFIESKRHAPLILKVITFCGILFVLLYLDWSGLMTGAKTTGEIHFGRLKKIPPVEQLNIIQLMAPILLLIVTRMKAPISTTFLILSLFSTKTNVIQGMLTKSLIGYGIAFSTAFILWAVLAKVFPREYEEGYTPNPKSERIWSVIQWLSTSVLWGSWVLQDIANIAVYLPRKLNMGEFLLAATIMAACLAYILKQNGGKIQEIVSEKSDIREAKAASLIDLIYAAILIFFKYLNSLPMSTTWVFLGLLAGREIILHVITNRDSPYLDTFRKVGKDAIMAAVGIIVSLAIYFISQSIYG